MDQGLLYVSVGTYALFSIVLWVCGSFFLLIDLTGKPAWFKQYKVQPGKNEPIPRGPLIKTLKVALSNQIFIGLPMSFLNGFLQQLRGCDLTLTFPGPVTFVRDVLIFICLEEIGFYYSHRLLHHPYFYGWIHKKHHEWTAPFSFVAIYAHPIEYIFSNITPLMLGPLVCGSPVVMTWLWFSVATFITLVGHSGYHLPFCPSPERHDFHHLKYNVNYGTYGLMDWFHNTDEKFLMAPQSSRDKVIFGVKGMQMSSHPRFLQG